MIPVLARGKCFRRRAVTPGSSIPPLASARMWGTGRSRLFFGDREIYLPLEDIDPGHENPQLVADGKAPARLPADQTALGRIESVEVVGEGRNMDEACEQDVRQFQEQAEIFDFEDSRAENLRIA